KDGNRRSEYQSRLVSAAHGADRIDQMPGTVEIDTIALIEFCLGLTGDDRCEMENHVWAHSHQRRGRTGVGEVTGHNLDGNGGARRHLRRHYILQGHARDITVAEPAVAHHTLNQFAANHTGGTKNENVQDPSPFGFDIVVSGSAISLL